MKKVCKLPLAILLLLNLIFLFSCRKTTDSQAINGGKVLLKVSAEVSSFEDGALTLKSKSTALEEIEDLTPLLDTAIKLSKDYVLLAALIPATDSNILGSANIISKSGNSAENVTLNPDVYYKLVVFRTTGGAYVTEKLYQRGSETPILLDGGVNYTFIAYSLNLNSISNVLNNSFSGMTLSTATLAINGDPDLLFFSGTKTISGEADDYLGIVFKHKFNEITTSIDASSTGYPIVGPVQPSFLTNISTATISFSDGTLARSGDAKSTTISFPNPIPANTTLITSSPTLFNTVSGANTLSITNLRIGEITEGTITIPKNIVLSVSLAEGLKYNLKLTIVAQDKYKLNYGGYGFDAARINGQVWMRHNVGIANIIDPDIIGVAIHGLYFQWGRKTFSIMGNSTTLTLAPPGWTGLQYNVPSAWNGNMNPDVNIREGSPSRTVNDPCPMGFRIPTKNEMSILVNSVVITNVGPGVNNTLDFSSAVILTSKRNSQVQLTLPKQGYYTIAYNSSTYPVYVWYGLLNRGQSSIYWNSYFTQESQDVNVQTSVFSNSIVSIRTINNGNTVISCPIRCIAIDNSL